MNLIDEFKQNVLPEKMERRKIALQYKDEFIKDYPRERIENLTMDEYLWRDDHNEKSNSFCSRIKRDQNHLSSMKGAWTHYFGVYRKDGGQLAMSVTLRNQYGDDYDSAFKAVKHEICGLLDAGAREDYSAIEACSINSFFKYKLLSIYFLDKYMPVNSIGRVYEYCTRVGLKYDKKEEPVYGLKRLMEWRDSVSEIADWDNFILMCFCDYLFRTERSIDGRALAAEKIEYRHKAKKIFEEIEGLPVKGEEKDAVVKIRINQGMFRDRLLQKYSKCCLCGVSEPSLLVASHIKPWRDSNGDERVDDENGLLMCPDHDKLFDKGWISFDNDGVIMISEKLKELDRMFMNVRPEMRIDLFERRRKYMEYHRENIFIRENQ